MRSLTKDPTIMNSAQAIVQFFRSRFSHEEITIEKEIDKLSKEKEVLKIMNKDIEKKIKNR